MNRQKLHTEKLLKKVKIKLIIMKKNTIKKTIYFAIFQVLLLSFAYGQETNSLTFFKNTRQEIKPIFLNLPINEIKPLGWIKAQMQQDIAQGFVGKLDELVPKIIKEDIYKTAQRKSKTDIPNAGTQVLTGAAWEISMQWWGGETQGNWWDGFMRNAFMINDKKAMAKADSFINRILASQDEDGYLGVYGKELRYKQEGDNGELWTQTTLFRLLLGYYELTQQKKVLEAVEKAMALTMSKYNANAKSPFKANTDFGGLTHGLMMTDVCETLHRITGNKKYNDFAVYLYQEFSTYPNERNYNDMRYEYLMDADTLFVGHGAHTYEHLRSLLLAYYSTDYPQLKNAYANALHKINFCLLPGGAGIGDEWIGGRIANPDSTAAEYCGMLELRNFYNDALQKTGLPAFADKAEILTFNSMQGARYGDGKGLTYCKTDNCIQLNKKSPNSGFKEEDVRYKYSPTHADAAVCCNPSYGRNLPYYVSNMWMKTADGFAAVLFGPSKLQSTYNSVPISITEATTYPFSDAVELMITTGEAVEFTIYIRKPNWVADMNIQVAGASVKEADGFYKVTKKWKTGDKIHVAFQNNIQPVQAFNNETFLQRGAIVYAYNIPSKNEVVKNYPIDSFEDFMVQHTDETYKNFVFIAVEKNNAFGFSYFADTKSNNDWYSNKTYLTGKVLNTQTNTVQPIKLIPMGIAILRKVTFKIN